MKKISNAIFILLIIILDVVAGFFGPFFLLFLFHYTYYVLRSPEQKSTSTQGVLPVTLSGMVQTLLPLSFVVIQIILYWLSKKILLRRLENNRKMFILIRVFCALAALVIIITFSSVARTEPRPAWGPETYKNGVVL